MLMQIYCQNTNNFDKIDFKVNFMDLLQKL